MIIGTSVMLSISLLHKPRSQIGNFPVLHPFLDPGEVCHRHEDGLAVVRVVFRPVVVGRPVRDVVLDLPLESVGRPQFGILPQL
jgi:hypothetical protein